MADPGFAVWGEVDLVGVHQLPKRLRLEKIVCQKKKKKKEEPGPFGWGGWGGG